MKKITIITINFNNRDGLEKTIKSVITQDYPNLEYIVIDGGSTDGSKELIEQYTDKIDFWVSEPDKGIYNAMNKGVAHATGDYVNFMNSGDCFSSADAVSRVMSDASDEDIIVGKVVASDDGREFFAPPADGVSLYFLYSSTISHQGAFISLPLQQKYLYDEGLRIVSDWKFFVQAIILDNCSLRFSRETMCFFDTTGLSTSNAEKTWAEKQSVMRSLFPERIIADYEHMKQSECLTQTLTPQLRSCYSVDKFLHLIGKFLLKVKLSIKK